jgi:phage shock protein PspC (stress-responsive transcriptional regulator)
MASPTSVIARDDTLLGVCFALGEDFGFSPLFLRLPLATILLWSPAAAIVVYAVFAAIVGVSRWIAPLPLALPLPVEAADAKASERPDERREELPLAA